jgi:hypothetical protein
MKSKNVKSIIIEYYDGEKETITYKDNTLIVESMSFMGIPWFVENFDSMSALEYSVTFRWLEFLDSTRKCVKIKE